MSTTASAPADDRQRAQLARALAALKDVRGQLDALKQQGPAEPIAIVGLGCRYPGGADDPEGFWRLLAEGRDAITQVPADRWDAAALHNPDASVTGTITSLAGGFLERIDEFDPQFFGIAPREAASLDPQQRLLLEVAWEAFEHAGIAADTLRGSATGVFVGIAGTDYAQLLMGAGPQHIDSYMGSGNAHSVAAGRLSYVFGFEGPSLAVDTACSSSLVAVHLACQSLRAGECDTALAGGVNALLAPAVSITHSRARMLAADGRCKAFDADADGFVRSEGCGLVVLKRLSRAQADGDQVLAVIRGSAVNQDGHSSGLTVPNGPSQQAVIRRALANAGVSPAQVSYVEAHGTGTALGDPIELQALAEVFAAPRVDAPPLAVGSVKTNFGHAEAAAGVAGLIKVVLGLEHDAIPAHLHLHTPTPRVDWARMPFVVPTSGRPWPRGAAPRVAGVSSFGFGGTNAHVVLADAPPAPAEPAETAEGPAEAPARTLQVLALSAQSEEALRALAARLAAHLERHPAPALDELCRAANTGRAPLRQRLCAQAPDRATLLAQLRAQADGQEAPGLLRHDRAGSARPPRIAFLFTGQGSQYAGMARGLYDSEPAFRRDLDHCDALLAPQLPRRLLDVLYGGVADGALERTEYTQPALFALQVCLGRLWMSWGVLPAALIGHSVGEYAAACLAGVFSLEDGLRLVAARARAMQRLAGDGAMAALLDTEAAVRVAIAVVAPQVEVAALNGPRHVVVAGPRAAVAQLREHVARSGVETHALAVSHAFHSALIEPALDELRRVAAGIALSAPRLDLVSNLSGDWAGAEVAQAEYWVRHARQAVRFHDGMQAVARHGVDLFLEIGPHPVLLGLGRGCLPDVEGQAWLPSLRRGQDDVRTLLHALGALWVRGAGIDWTRFHGGRPRRPVPLPTYPFQRQRCWSPAAQAGARRGGVADPADHPLLGVRHERACQPEVPVWESRLGVDAPAWLGEHRVFGAPVLPASGYVELALAAAAALGEEAGAVTELDFLRPLALDEAAPCSVQTTLLPATTLGRPFQVHSRAAAADANTAWTLHATGCLVSQAQAPQPPSPAPEDLAGLRRRIATETGVAELYDGYARHGVQLGATLRAVEQLWRGEGEALGRLRVPDTEAARDGRYRLHPLWLDACAQVLGAATPDDGTTWLQTRFDRLRLQGHPGTVAWAHARLRPGSAAVRVADLRLYGEAGELLLEVLGLHARPVEPALVASGSPYVTLEWRAAPDPGAVLPTPAALAPQLRLALGQSVDDPAVLAYADALAALDARSPARIAAALRALGWCDEVGASHTLEQLMPALGIAPQQRRLLQRLLQMLAPHGVLRRDGERWTQIAALPLQEPALTSAAAPMETELFDRCTARLADVLAGRCDGLSLLFGDDRRQVGAVYGETPGAAAMNGLLRHAVSALARALPPGRGLRVLEIGAGTGGATAHVLPVLPPGSEYVYTDVSPGYFAAARERFAAYPWVRWQTLDVERDPQAQGFTAGSFDVVVAFNVLHATRLLGDSVAHAQSLLAPGGMLLLLENTAPADWVDLIWGLTPGWWRFEDGALRPDYPLLDLPRWHTLLAGAGFTAVDSVAADASHHPVMGRQALVLARKGTAAPPRRTWALLADAGGVGLALARRLESRGEQVLLLPRAAQGDQPPSAQALAQALAPLAQAGGDCAVVHLCGLDAGDAAEASPAALAAASVALTAGALHLAQAEQRLGVAAPLWLVTRGASAAGGSEAPLALAAAALGGIGLTLARECPALWGGLLDLDHSQGAEADAAAILDVLDAPGGEDAIALRRAQRLVARVTARHTADNAEVATADPVPVHGDASYLITGGCGGLGLELARWLAERGARHLALLSRHGPVDEEARRRIAALEAQGVHVRIVRADVADEAALHALVAQLQAQGCAVRGVVHAAGLPGRCAIEALDAAALARLQAAKVAGTWALHRATLGQPLDFFIACSSMVSLWGAREQAHYVAANRFVDLFVHHRRALGLPALGINWGPLAGGGMLPDADIPELARIGVSATPLADAPRVAAQLLAAGAVQAAPVRIAWPRLRDAYQARRSCRVFDDVAAAAEAAAASAPPAAPATGAQGPGRLAEQLGAVPPSERRARVVEHVQATLARVLGLQGRLPDRAQSFFDLGMDSLTALELRTQLQASVGASLPSTLAFDYGTSEALADFLLGEVLARSPAPQAAEPAPQSPPLPSLTAAELAQMSDAEVEALLQARLLSHEAT